MVIISPVPAPYSRNEEHLDDMAELVVAGMGAKVGGTKESVAAFRKHHEDLSRQLLNVAEGLDKDDPRPILAPQEYPMMIYSPRGSVVVKSAQERDKYFEQGYRMQPYPKPQVLINDPKTEKLEMQRENKELRGQLTSQQDQINKLEQMLMESMAQKRGPGRPPNPDKAS